MKPGTKYDLGKLRYDLLDPCFEEELVQVLTYGTQKYADDNWKHVEPLRARYYAAFRRHVAAWRKGEKIDQESGLPHLAHAACCLMFISWADRRDGAAQVPSVRRRKA